MRRIAAVSVLILLACGATFAQQRQQDSLPPTLFPVELVLDRQEEIGLSDEQLDAVSQLVEQLQAENTAISNDVAEESEQFQELLSSARVNEGEALASIDRLLDLEHRSRRSQLLQLIRLKNILTESQQQRLQDIRSGSP